MKTLTIQISLSSRNTRRHNVLAGMSMELVGRCRAHAHGYAQARVWNVQARDKRTQKSLSTSGFVGVNCVPGFICVNMLKKQSKARAGGLFEELPGCCFVRQTAAAARQPAARRLTTVVSSHKHAQVYPVEPWALPSGGSEGSWISVQRHYKRDGHCRVHRSKHSSLNLASVPFFNLFLNPHS